MKFLWEQDIIKMADFRCTVYVRRVRTVVPADPPRRRASLANWRPATVEQQHVLLVPSWFPRPTPRLRLLGVATVT